MMSRVKSAQRRLLAFDLSRAARSLSMIVVFSMPTESRACGSSVRHSSGIGAGGNCACASPWAIAALFSLLSRLAQEEVDIVEINAASTAALFQKALILGYLRFQLFGCLFFGP